MQRYPRFRTAVAIITLLTAGYFASFEPLEAQKGGQPSTAIADMVFDDSFGKVRSDGFPSTRCGGVSPTPRYCGSPEPLTENSPNGILGVGPECSRIYYAVRDGNYVFRPRTTLDCTPDPGTNLVDGCRRVTIDFDARDQQPTPTNCTFTQNSGDLNVCATGQLIDNLQLFADGLFTAADDGTTTVRIEIEQLTSPAGTTHLELRYESPLQVSVEDGSRTVSTTPETGAFATLWEHRVTVTRKKTTTVVEQIGRYYLPLKFTARPHQ